MLKELIALLRRAAAAIETPGDLTKEELEHVAEDLNIKATELENTEDTPPSIKDDAVFDAFLDDATHAVHNMWVSSGGTVFTTEDLYALNDVLTQHFSSKR